jgi:exodeoxyribonuclease VII large subunit
MEQSGPLFTAPLNVPEYTVGEISEAIKATLEDGFGRVRVRGEITECKRYPSGHVYFSLKDERAKLAAVIWRQSAARLTLKPENGMEVVAEGRISAYADRSTYQLIVERLDYAGEGALLAEIERRKQRLAAEGLFEAARKRPLPFLPGLIGVITSERGAVIEDIRTTVARRFPRPILLWPVPVQGAEAAPRIAAAIRGFAALPAEGPGLLRRPDVLIVARGGGSLEDLMAFNDEEVVRAAALSPIPLISAVGHETDTTLIDYAADRRAPTPTAAAELAVPSRHDLALALRERSARLESALKRRLEAARRRLEIAALKLPNLPRLAAEARQRLDERSERLAQALPRFVAARRQTLAQLGERLRHAAASRLVRAERAAAGLLGRLRPSLLQSRLREARARLEGLAGRLSAVGPEAVLARGYVLVRDQAGEPVTRAAQLAPHQRVELRFQDGAVPAEAFPDEAAAPGKKPEAPRRRASSDAAALQPKLPLS